MKHVVKKIRINAGRKESLSCVAIGFTECKNNKQPANNMELMGGKTKCGKRHFVVDVSRCLLLTTVHTTNIHDIKGGISTVKQTYDRYPSVKKFCADAGYRRIFVSGVKEHLNLDVGISERIKPNQWEKLPRHRVVGRTFSWFNHSKRF